GVFVLPQAKWHGTKWAAELVEREGPMALRALLQRESVEASQYIVEHLQVNGHESSDHWQSNDDDTAETPDSQTSEPPTPPPNVYKDRPQCPLHHCDETDCFCFD
ncbi:MAG TPA: hypothetical protein VE890_01000, partial [Thermoguttaceae bacterium]|nr:hypothetical protein [Thermoguttaceae bacterium]